MGEGIKKVKAFICSLTKEKLEKYRKEFWGYYNEETRIEGNPKIWKILNQACNVQPSEAELLLSSNSIKIYQNMQICIDSVGHLYKLPRSVIQDPKEYVKEENEISVPIPTSIRNLKVLLNIVKASSSKRTRRNFFGCS